MNIFLYVIIFMCGTMFGSFYTLAVYRIPKNIDIVKKHSYCPNCNHRLGILDLIPILSYIFLGGKCRYCKQKIRPRYLILEVISGIIFMIFAYIFNINIYTITIKNILPLIFMILYFTAVVLISAIDKEYRNINKKVLAYGIIISVIYMIYLYVIDSASIYRYVIYLAIYIMLLIVDTFVLRKLAKNSYYIDLLLYFMIMIIFMGNTMAVLTIFVLIIELLVHILIAKLLQKRNGNKKIKLEQIQLAFYLGIGNIIVMLTIGIMNIIR